MTLPEASVYNLNQFMSGTVFILILAYALPLHATTSAGEWHAYLRRHGFGKERFVESLAEDLSIGRLTPEQFEDPVALSEYTEGLADRAVEILARPDLSSAATIKGLGDQATSLYAVSRALDKELPARLERLLEPLREALAHRLRLHSNRLEEQLSRLREPWTAHPDDELVYRDWLDGMSGKPSATAASPFLAMGRLESLSRRIELPEFVTTAVAQDLVKHHASRNYADLILANQKKLPPSTLRALRSGLQSAESDTRLKAASYVLLHDPQDVKSIEVVRDHIESSPDPRGWESLLHRTLLAGHDFFFETTRDQVLAVARKKFRQRMARLGVRKSHRRIDAAFERFLDRALRYTHNARRLTKTVKDAISGVWPQDKVSFWDGLLPDPEGTRQNDMAFQRAALDGLRSTLPHAMAEENRRIEADGHPGLDRIAGALIVGSIASGHPTIDSDLDMILITENGGPVPTEAITRLATSLKHKNLPLVTVDRVIDAQGWGFNRRAGSLGVQRLIARGAIFIPVE